MLARLQEWFLRVVLHDQELAFVALFVMVAVLILGAVLWFTDLFSAVASEEEEWD